MRLLSGLAVRLLPLLPRAVVWRVARRYIAGTTRDDALEEVRRLRQSGAMATLALLGEEVEDRTTAEEATEEYLHLLEVLDGGRDGAGISIKLTMLGLAIDEAFCRRNAERIVAAAEERGTFVRLDMEDRTTTDATLGIYGDLFADYGNVGIVLQAYMRRTLGDIDTLPSAGANVRLCKGIYIEPREVAWKGYETIRANFDAALDKLLDSNAYVGIATHDEYLICRAAATIDQRALEPEEYEFQMLLGVDDELRSILIGAGHRLRVYIPYGEDWYDYSVRRLRENPQIAGHVMRAMLGR